MVNGTASKTSSQESAQTAALQLNATEHFWKPLLGSPELAHPGEAYQKNLVGGIASMPVMIAGAKKGIRTAMLEKLSHDRDFEYISAV